MVGLVIVSHSYWLAQGILELAHQMAPPAMKIAAAGGLDGPERALGTDPFLVQKAIEAADDPDGVLVLMDLGSAILSAEMALDFMAEETRQRVLLCEAPLVEGALAAAVQAGLGSNLATVAAEARNALLPKTTQLAAPVNPLPVAPKPNAEAEAQCVRLPVRNRLGLHARPAAIFVQTVARFDAKATVRNLSRNGPAVDARSINLVATQAIRQGDEVEVCAEGREAVALLAALQQLAADGFGDGIEPVTAPTAAPHAPAVTHPPAAAPMPRHDAGESAHHWRGVAAAPGIALGPARRFQAVTPTAPPRRQVAHPAAEWERLLLAIQATRRRIEATRDHMQAQGAGDEALIFTAHLLFLDDPALLDPAHDTIFGQACNAEAAWLGAVEATAGAYAALAEPYLQARAADVRDVGQQVLLALLGHNAGALRLSTPGILIADDLAPSETANLERPMVMALCTAGGGPTSHTAILARSLGIPAVVGLGPRLLALPESTLLAVDGDSGQVWIEPNAEEQRVWTERSAAWQAARCEATASSHLPATTLDGTRVEVVANIGSVADARQALEMGAEGVGLLRTEFLYLGRTQAPSEEEQEEIYRAIFTVMGQRPVVARTLDVGGDKDLPYVNLGHEDNPFLGARALRLYRERPDLIEPQLRALLRAGAGRRLRIMFPMAAISAEVMLARSLVEDAQRAVAATGVAPPAELQVGVMIEIPAAALLAEKLAPLVDFFSIGTNDLTQYTMAAERGNPRVAYLNDALHPAVLRLIAQTITAAHAHGRWVGVCGELAGDPTAIPVLLGLGLDEFSMNPTAIPTAKQLLRRLDRAASAQLAQTALACDSAAAVRAAVQAVVGTGERR